MSKGNNSGGSDFRSVIAGFLVSATLSITVLTVAVLANFNKDVSSQNLANTNMISAVETLDCETISAVNHVCHAQRGRVDPRVLQPLMHNYNRDSSDWNCFLLIFGVIAVFVGLAMSNKNGQQ